MPRKKGSLNKLTTQLKEKLAFVIDGVVDSIDLIKLNVDQKIKLLQVGIQYIVPRLKHKTNDDMWEDQPLFIETEIIKRDNEGEWTSEKHMKTYDNLPK